MTIRLSTSREVEIVDMMKKEIRDSLKRIMTCYVEKSFASFDDIQRVTRSLEVLKELRPLDWMSLSFLVSPTLPSLQTQPLQETGAYSKLAKQLVEGRCDTEPEEQRDYDRNFARGGLPVLSKSPKTSRPPEESNE